MSGVKGKSGRKNKILEQADYKRLINLFYGKTNLAKLQKKIAKGKYSAEDYMLLELLTAPGKEARQTVLKKLFPDSVINNINVSGEIDGINLGK